ncbi:MAG TPA: phage tail protein [Candidatus Binataceae bacterium]|jgi:phage protein U
MFGVFGEIVFDLLGSPEGFQSTLSWDYAEHRVVEDRPKLQWIADGLETIELDFHFHASFTNPSSQVEALIAAANDHNARPLIFGNGSHRGYFVVTSLRTSSQVMAADGSLISITVRAVLKEWASDSEITPAASLVDFPLIGIVTALPGTSTSSIAYAEPTGIGDVPSAPTTAYVPPSLASPGVSPLLNIPGDVGLPTPELTFGDVTPSAIVRAAP